MKQFNLSSKNLKTGKYWTYGYGSQFDDKDGKQGNIVIKFKKEQLQTISKALAEGELQYDDYGYVKFTMFPSTFKNKIDKVDTLKNDDVPF
jgi:hypothetical protein